jgi:hypothetical protein
MALLVKTTLEDFFRVIDATAVRQDMWMERKEFWLAYWRGNAIDHAWVAFGPGAASRAGALGHRYGSLNGGAQSHSALILRISDLTIIEMSHDGRCLFFPNPREPRPGNYDLSYNSPAMRDQCTAYGNSLTHRGDWRPRFAAAIYEYTGIRHPSYGAGY